MNKSIHLLFLILALLLTGIDSHSQYYVKFKTDSVGFEKDSVVLALDNIITDNLDWEISKDSTTWESLNQSNDTLVIRISDNSFYRAVLTEGTCDPIKSDVAFAGFKSIEVFDNSVVIAPEGGVYILPSGIKLFIPPNAVDENVTVSLALLDSLNAEIQLPFDADTGKVFCAGLLCEPAETQFLKPIKISIPAPNIQHNDLPYVYRHDVGTGFWEKFTHQLVFSEKMQVVEFSSDELVSTRIQLFKDLFEFANTTKAANPEDPPEDICKQGFIKAISDAYDRSGQIGSTECYVSSDKTTVIFLECPGNPIHQAQISEIGKNCEPKATDNLADLACLEKGERKIIDVKVTIGGMPLKMQDIQFDDLPAGLSVVESQNFTDENGIAQFQFECTDDDISGTVYYKVYYKYFLEIIEASDGVVSEKNNNHERNGIIDKNQFIGKCPIKSIKILADRVLKVGETTPIECECRDLNNDLVDCGEVEYTLSNVYTFPSSDIISVNNGLVTGLKPGIAAVQASVGNIKSDIERGTFSVTYEGELKDLNIIFDNNIYKKCACEQDLENPPYDYNWWVVGFTGDYAITFSLSPIFTEAPSADLIGGGVVTYSISGSTLCTGASLPQSIDKTNVTFNLLPPNNGVPSIENILAGDEFKISFYPIDDYFPYMVGKAKMISHHEIEFTITDFQPDGCIQKDVEGSCILK